MLLSEGQADPVNTRYGAAVAIRSSQRSGYTRCDAGKAASMGKPETAAACSEVGTRVDFWCTGVVCPYAMPRCSWMAADRLREPHSMQGVVPHTRTWYLPTGDRLNMV